MRITYVTHTRFPTEKAHGVQIAHVCDALAKLGHTVTLVTPTVWNSIKESPFTYYDIPANFEIIQLSHFDALKSKAVPGFLGFLVGMFFYRRELRKYFALRQTDIIYIRSPFLLSALPDEQKTIVELHTLSSRIKSLLKKEQKKIKKIVCLTSPMKEELVASGIDASGIIIEADAVDLNRFQATPAKDSAKQRWNLPGGVPVIGYIGSLITQRTLEKGVESLIDACARLEQTNTKFLLWIVGGSASEKRTLENYAQKNGLSQVRFLDRIASKDVPSALSACDIAVYPVPDSDHPYFHRDTSPLKLFEYAAAGVPVIAADTKPVRDVFSDKEVLFYEAGNTNALAEKLSTSLSDAAGGREHAAHALELVQKHSWEARMQRVLLEGT